MDLIWQLEVQAAFDLVKCFVLILEPIILLRLIVCQSN